MSSLPHDESVSELFGTSHVGCFRSPSRMSGDFSVQKMSRFIPVEARAGLFDFEGPDSARAASSAAIGRGVLHGSNADAPEPGSRTQTPGSPRRRHRFTIAHVDMAAPARRVLDGDETALESIHAAALAAHGPKAFFAKRGASAGALNIGVVNRSVTPLYNSHMRLSSLDTTLLSLALAPGERGVAPYPPWMRAGEAVSFAQPRPHAATVRSPFLGSPRSPRSRAAANKSPTKSNAKASGEVQEVETEREIAV